MSVCVGSDAAFSLLDDVKLSVANAERVNGLLPIHEGGEGKKEEE